MGKEKEIKSISNMTVEEIQAAIIEGEKNKKLVILQAEQIKELKNKVKSLEANIDKVKVSANKKTDEKINELEDSLKEILSLLKNPNSSFLKSIKESRETGSTVVKAETTTRKSNLETNKGQNLTPFKDEVNAMFNSLALK